MGNICFRFSFITLFATFLAFFSPCNVNAAEIGNCHSFVYWKLTGKAFVEVTSGALKAELRNMQYKEIPYPGIPPFSDLEIGDVVTFGDRHSAIVETSKCFSNIRKTTIYSMNKRTGIPKCQTGTTYKIKINKLTSYPNDFENDLIKQSPYQDITKKELKRLKDGGWIGFYKQNDTFIELINRFRGYDKINGHTRVKLFQTNISIWKQARLRIKPNKVNAKQGDIVQFSAYFGYPDKKIPSLSNPIIGIIPNAKWKPKEVQNGLIDTFSISPEEHTITAEAATPPRSRPWFLKGKHQHYNKASAKLFIDSPYDAINQNHPVLVPPVMGSLNDTFETKNNDYNPDDVRLLFVEPATKTSTIGESVPCRAILWLKNGEEVDITEQAAWTGAPGGVFTPAARGTFTVKATYNDFSGSETIKVEDKTWAVYEGQQPISNAGDVNANVPRPGPSDYQWYVLCNKMSGDVVYSKYIDPTQHIIMAGPLPGPRTAAGWIMDYCPRGRCTTDGRCANEPVKGGKWNVICNKKTGDVTFANHSPRSSDYQIMAGNFRGEPEARLWQQQNCPLARCDYNGQCVLAPDSVKTGQGDWYIACNLSSGDIEVCKNPFNFSSYRVMDGPFLGAPDARFQIGQKYPSLRCDSQGRYLPAAKDMPPEDNEFALPGDPSTLQSIADSEAMKSQGDKFAADVKAFMKPIDQELKVRQQQANTFTQEALNQNFQAFLQIITSNPQYLNTKRPDNRQPKYELNIPGPKWNPVDGWGGATSGDDPIYCPGDIEVRQRKCAEADQFLRSVVGDRWKQDIERTQLFKEQCCGSNWSPEVSVDEIEPMEEQPTEDPTRNMKSYEECLAGICPSCGQGISLAGEEYDNPECNRCKKARAQEIKACMEGR